MSRGEQADRGSQLSQERLGQQCEVSYLWHYVDVSECVCLYCLCVITPHREVQKYVYNMVGQDHQTVGCPSELEARKFLALSQGNVMTASHKIFANRREKVENNRLRKSAGNILPIFPALSAPD